MRVLEGYQLAGVYKITFFEMYVVVQSKKRLEEKQPLKRGSLIDFPVIASRKVAANVGKPLVCLCTSVLETRDSKPLKSCVAIVCA